MVWYGLISCVGVVRPQLYGSADIISFLFKTYGPGEAAIPNSLKGKGGGGGGGRGAKVRANTRPDNTKMKPITLYECAIR